MPAFEEYSQVHKYSTTDLEGDYITRVNQANRRFVYVELTAAFRQYSESFFNSYINNEGSIVSYRLDIGKSFK